MTTKMAPANAAAPWDAAAVRRWLDRRIVAARAEQAVAARGGRREADDSDKASAEEMVATLLTATDTTRDQATFAAAMRALLDRDDYHWRGVHDDDRFDRHVRAFLRKLAKMTKANEGFDRLSRYQ
ncbi:hypothetical protein [Sphingomonas sp. TZW2008]|uniref:hypothetical protein n=1 Tax=Sphingomonas sp. TZW2008 TaxID=1917973 RepID=UPI00211A69E0|nr:hypothetical protein [Sphingomonas sp. TZW2008]